MMISSYRPNLNASERRAGGLSGRNTWMRFANMDMLEREEFGQTTTYTAVSKGIKE